MFKYTNKLLRLNNRCAISQWVKAPPFGLAQEAPSAYFEYRSIIFAICRTNRNGMSGIAIRASNLVIVTSREHKKGSHADSFITIEWANGADFAPEYLYQIGKEDEKSINFSTHYK
jgi:hypothetical protein